MYKIYYKIVKDKLIIMFSILFMIYFSGCISTCKVKLTGCDHPSGWCNEIRNISNKAWKYAQLSKNVYNKPFTFLVTDYFEKIQDYENQSLDFFATLYRDKSTNEFVIVFRGTDSFTDFQSGNLTQSQNEYALKIYDEIKKQYEFNKCIVTGHSLGGAIAINISLNRMNTTVFSFNTSPVFKNIKNISNDRYSIVENGEILKLFRLFGREATQLYTSIGCTNGDAVNQHDMKSLAICLTQIASIESIEAKNSLIQNGIQPEY